MIACFVSVSEVYFVSVVLTVAVIAPEPSASTILRSASGVLTVTLMFLSTYVSAVARVFETSPAAVTSIGNSKTFVSALTFNFSAMFFSLFN